MAADSRDVSAEIDHLRQTRKARVDRMLHDDMLRQAPGNAAYWVAVVVGRGVVSWSLGRFATPLVPVPLRRGAPSGPWHSLPTLALDGDTLGGRVRAIGKAPATAPVPPLTVTVAGHETSHIDVTPTTKGVSATWLAPGTASGTNHPSITPTGSTITLRFTSRMTGTIKLSAVDVVATK